MQNLLKLRAAQLSLTAAASIVAASGLTIVTTSKALAEFEIQESQVEKGELEIEYRGAVHWGVPGVSAAGGALEEEIEPGLRQSHDLEVQWSATNRLQLSVTFSFTEPLGEDLNLTSVEGEVLYELIERKGDGLGLAFDFEYGQAINHGDEEEANEIAFGPFTELAKGDFLLTLNPLFTYQVGPHAETDGLGFEYGWRGQYNFARKWAVGVEMFGEIEDLSHTGPWNDQNHSIGPVLILNPEDDDDNGDDDDDDHKVGGPPKVELSFNIGVQFGLTEATSDTALKFQGSIGF